MRLQRTCASARERHKAREHAAAVSAGGRTALNPDGPSATAKRPLPLGH